MVGNLLINFSYFKYLSSLSGCCWSGSQAVRDLLFGTNNCSLPPNRTGLAYDERMKEHVCHDKDMIWEIIKSGEMPDGDGYVVMVSLVFVEDATILYNVVYHVN